MTNPVSGGVPEQGLREQLAAMFANEISVLEELTPDSGDETRRKIGYSLSLADVRVIAAALERPRPALPAPQDCPKCGGLDGTHVVRNCPGAELPPQTGNPRPDLERLARDELISVCDLYERRLAHSEELRAGLAAALHEAHIAAGLKIGDRVPQTGNPPPDVASVIDAQVEAVRVALDKRLRDYDFTIRDGTYPRDLAEIAVLTLRGNL